MRLANVAFRYGRRGPWVLRDVSVTLRPGDIVELTGPNGAGKSTLLRLLAGLHRPHHGAITERPASVGYAPERFPTDQPFTVSAYLAHMSALHGLPPSAAARWTHLLNLDHLLSTSLGDLSKGSAQKVGLIQALLPAPPLLLLDEPFSGLDATTLDLLPKLLASLAAEGTTIVLSDHQRVLHQPDAAPFLPTIRHFHLSNTTLTDQSTSTPPSVQDRTPAPAAAPTLPNGFPAAPAPRLASHTSPSTPASAASTSPSAPSAENGQGQPLPSTAPGDNRQAEAARQSTAVTGEPPLREPSESPPNPSLRGEWTVLEVVVRADEADDVERGLRAAGRIVRRVDHS
ncbi:ATP-binding cassette domain-containing protein [Spirillospora sp. NPDC049652]